MKRYVSIIGACLLAGALSAITASAHVNVTVLCPNGNTAAGIHVCATLTTDSSQVVCGDTDNTGFVRLSVPVIPGSYHVCVDVSTLPAGATLSQNCQDVTFTANDELHADFVLGGDFCGPPSPCVPTQSCITSGFNGTSINPANCIWFNANFSAQGIPATGATITFANSTVTINGTTYPVPGGTITFSPAATCATTFFDGTQWQTTVPVGGSDEILLSAFSFSPTSNLRGATVTWCGDFSADTTGVSIHWKWGAAVYTCLCGVDYNSVLVKPTHSNSCNYNNADHAGTPENPNIKHCVIGGARGGGGSNFTGSWSGTAGAGLCE